MNKIELSQHQFKRLYSYKEQRIKSAKKLNLNVSMISQNAIEQIQTTIKDNLIRRMSQSKSSLLNSDTEYKQSTQLKQHNLEELRQSSVSIKFIQKYMGDHSNIMQVNQQEVIKNRQIDNNTVSRFSKKKFSQQKSSSLINSITKFQQSKPLKQSVKKQVSKFEINKVVKRIEVIKSEIQKMGLVCGKDISTQFTNILTKLRDQ